jgi:hypothetical protein
MGTCHYFHNALTTEIKINGNSPGESLRTIQYQIVRRIAPESSNGRVLILKKFRLSWVVSGRIQHFWKAIANTSFWERWPYTHFTSAFLPHLENLLRAKSIQSFLVGQRISTGVVEEEIEEWLMIELVCGRRSVPGYDFPFYIGFRDSQIG